MIEVSVKAAEIKKIVQAVKDQDQYVHDVILPKFKDILPKDRFQ
jgi:(2Fe-2S) ferredoxin